MFFFNAPATTEIYTLSLHDALPISRGKGQALGRPCAEDPRRDPLRPRGQRRHPAGPGPDGDVVLAEDRKSTRLNSSHGYISYAVFCLKKKKNHNIKYKNAWKSTHRT